MVKEKVMLGMLTNIQNSSSYNRNVNFGAGEANQSVYKKTLKYAADTPEVRAAAAALAAKTLPDKDSFLKNTAGQLPYLAVFEGIPLALFLKRNHALKGAMTPVMKQIGAGTQTALKNIAKGSEGNLFQRICKYIAAANENKNVYGTLKSVTKAKANKSALKNAANAAGKHKWLPDFVNKFLRKRGLAKYAAAEKISSSAVAASAGAGGIKGVLKSSGALFSLGISALFEAFEIIPAFKNLGFEKGMKQTAKSAAKISGETAGFIAGDIAGTAIGSAIGSLLGPIGAVLGGAAGGFITGCLGCHYAGKAVKAVTGKSENEIAKEQKLYA